MAKKSYPKVKLVVDSKADTRFAVNLIGNILSGKSIGFPDKFLPYALHYVLDKKMPKQKRARLISGYARYMYKDHKQEMESGVRTARADWARVEKYYFRLVDKLFKRRPWPKGKYIGISTVWHSYPRNIDDKTFYFPYRHVRPRYSNYVTAHELLHFMFFDYIHEKYGLKQWTKLPGKPKNYIWVLSEAFNNVIEEWLPYKKIFKYGARTHQGVEKTFAKMNKQWKKKQDVDWLLDKWLKVK